MNLHKAKGYPRKFDQQMKGAPLPTRKQFTTSGNKDVDFYRSKVETQSLATKIIQEPDWASLPWALRGFQGLWLPLSFFQLLQAMSCHI